MTPDTTLPVPLPPLGPCPFCGAGETQFKENGKMWLGMKYSEPTSVSVQHWCAETPGQPKRMIERVGRDRASAVAAWNARACMAPLQEELAIEREGRSREHAEWQRLYAKRSGELAPLQERADALQAENDTLRGLLGNSAKPCTYCGLAAEDQGKCQYGFPGCMRADDQMLSKHFADGYWAEQAQKRADVLEEALRELATKAAALLYDLSEDHGDDHFEPECNICRSYKELSALVDGSLINPTGGES